LIVSPKVPWQSDEAGPRGPNLLPRPCAGLANVWTKRISARQIFLREPLSPVSCIGGCDAQAVFRRLLRRGAPTPEFRRFTFAFLINTCRVLWGRMSLGFDCVFVGAQERQDCLTLPPSPCCNSRLVFVVRLYFGHVSYMNEFLK
jgi:hypothetical protein